MRVTHGKSVWHSGRRRLAALLLVISWLSGLPSLAQYVPDTAPNQPAEARTETDGEERLSLSGGFVAPQITLDLPPGRRGMTPSIGLVYSPGTVNGILGVGWNLTFGSRIDRMSTNRGVDAVEASAESRYFVDGVELVETFNGTFRRLQTDFTVFRIVSNLSGSPNPIGWIAKKSGITSVYGKKADVVVGEAQNAVLYADESVSSSGIASGVKSHAWLLSSVEDEFNNQINFYYTIPTSDNGIPHVSYQHLIGRIDYGNAAKDHHYSVRFRYKDRSDTRVAYDGGVGRWHTKLLDRIEVVSVEVIGPFAKETPVARYGFEYTTATHDSQALLTRVTRIGVNPATGADGEVVTLRSMAYNDQKNEWLEATDLTLFGPYVSLSPTVADFPAEETVKEIRTTLLVADVNGDSLPDIVSLNDAVKTNCLRLPPGELGGGCVQDYIEAIPQHRVFLNTRETGPSGLVFQYSTALSSSLTFALGPTTQITGSGLQYSLLDVNRDGFPDLVKGKRIFKSVGLKNRSSLPEDHVEADDRSVSLGSQVGWLTTMRYRPDWVTNALMKDYELVDLNGDLFPDLVGLTNAFLHTGDSNPTNYYNLATGAANTHYLAIDDPVLEDAGGSDASGYGAWSSGISTMVLRQDVVMFGEGYYPDSGSPEFADVNITPQQWLRRNTTHVDVNSDGFADRVYTLRFPDFEAEHGLWGYTNDGPADPPTDLRGPDIEPNPNYYRVFFGNGRASFTDAHYGVGPSSNFRSFVGHDPYDDTPPSSEWPYTYYLNRMAVIDMDGSGRADLVQLTKYQATNGTPISMGTLQNHRDPVHPLLLGSLTAGFSVNESNYVSDLKYLNQGLSNCLFAVGSDPLRWGAAIETFADFNNDGVADVLRSFVGKRPCAQSSWFEVEGGCSNVPETLNVPTTGPTLHVWLTSRSAPQNRLIKMSGPYGGSTTYDWGMSGASGGETYLSVPVLSAVENRRGRYEYTFEDGVVNDGRFLGFKKVTKTTPTGWLEVLHYHVVPQFPGVLEAVARFNAAGWNEETTLYEYQNVSYNSTSETWTYGVAPYPYFYPLKAESVYDFDPVKIESEGHNYGVPLLRTITEGFTGEPAGAVVPSPDPTYRHSRTEWVWDIVIGKPRMQRDYRDVSTPDDSLITTLTYHDYDTTLEESLPHTTETWTVANTTTGTSARRVQNQETKRAEYVGTEWTRSVQTPSTGSPLAAIVNRRGIDNATGDVISTRDARDFQSTFTFDDAGRLLQSVNPEGNSETYTYDGASRLVQQHSSSGLRLELQYDDLGRMIYRRTADGSPVPAIETRWDHDWGRVGEPATAMIVTEPDGTQTVAFEYFNEHAQLTNRIRGQRQSGLPDTWSTSLTDAFGLTGAGSIFQRWSYDGHGRLQHAFSPNSTTTKQTYKYDEWDRVVRLTFEDGTSVSNFYSLDTITSHDAEDIRRVNTKTTLLSSSWVDNHPRVRVLHDALGNPVRRTAGVRRIHEYTYDGFNRLANTLGTEVEVLNSDDATPGPARATTTYEYSPTGEITAQIEPDGRRFEFKYDGAGRLTQKRGPEAPWEVFTPASSAPAVLPELSIELTDEGLLSVEWVAVGDAMYDLEWTASLVAPVEWESLDAVPRIMGDLRKVLLDTDTLEGFFRLRWWWTPPLTTSGTSRLVELNTYDDRPYPNRKVTTQNEYGTTSTRQFDGWGRVYRFVDLDGSVTTTEYDLRGRVAATVLPFGERLAYTHDRHGRRTTLTSIRGAQSATTTFNYDARGNLLSSVDADGVLARSQYDTRSRPTLATQGEPARTAAEFSYDDIGRPVSQLQAGSRTARWFDSRGRITRQSVGYNDAAARGLVETASAYDDLDLPVSVTVGPDDPVTGGGETLWTYDNMGQMKGRTIRSHDGITANQATYDYDINGRLTRTTDGRGVPTRIAYDGRGRPASRTTPGNGTTSMIYVDNPLDPFNGSRFLGVAVQTLDAEGVASTAYADSLGRTRYVIVADGTSVENIFSNGLLTEQRRYTDTCALRGVKRFYYAPNSSRLRFETEWMTSAQAAACTGTPPCAGIGHTEYTYTSAGRVATVRDPAGNVSSTSYLDDASGLPARSVVGGVTEIAYEYLTGLPRLAAQVLDPDGTPLRTEITWERGTRIQSLRWTASGKPQEIVEHQYDEAGLSKQSRVLQGPSPTPRVVVNRSWTPAGQLATKQYTVDGLPFSPTAWAYELNGQLASVLYPSGNVAEYDYLTGTRLLERIRLATGTSILGSMTYDRAGRPTAMLLAGSAAETHVAATIAYDWAGRAVTRNINGVAPSGLRTESFAYDSAGRLALLNTAEATANWSKNYEYDHRDMLVREVHSATDPARPNLEIGYTLSPVTGRRIQRQAVGPTSTNVLALTYGAGNQLATVNGLSIGHDTYGRQLNDHRGNGYEWNLRGRLAAIVETNGPVPQIEAMLFDPDGQRVRRQYGGAQGHFLLADHPGRVMHQALAGGATRDLIYSPGGALLAQVSGTGGVVPVLESITASPALIGSSASGLFERDFDGFGNALDVNGTPNSDADFHGMWSTRGTSRLKAAGHRFYDPELGRFLSTDPMGFSGSANGLGRLDLYRYAAQSPTLYRDPEGLQEQPLVQHRRTVLTPRFGIRPPYFSIESPVPGEIHSNDGKTKMERMIDHFAGEADESDRDRKDSKRQGKKGKNPKATTPFVPTDGDGQYFTSGFEGTGTGTDDDPYIIVVTEKRRKPSPGRGLSTSDQNRTGEGIVLDKDLVDVLGEDAKEFWEALDAYGLSWSGLSRSFEQLRQELEVIKYWMLEKAGYVQVGQPEVKIGYEVAQKAGTVGAKLKTSYDVGLEPGEPLVDLGIPTVTTSSGAGGMSIGVKSDGSTVLKTQAGPLAAKVNQDAAGNTTSVEAELKRAVGPVEGSLSTELGRPGEGLGLGAGVKIGNDHMAVFSEGKVTIYYVGPEGDALLVPLLRDHQVLGSGYVELVEALGGW